MQDITKSVTKKDHFEKVSGKAAYIADYDIGEVLIGKFLRSTKANAKITGLKFPDLPEGYTLIDYKDVPANNEIAIVEKDMPVFPEEYVRYKGEPILMVVGMEEKVVDKILRDIQVDYEEAQPVYSMEKAKEYHFSYSYKKGREMEEIFRNADRVVEETFRTGYQEQAYLEPQGVVADYKDGKVSISGSLQCPYYIYNAVKHATGFPDGQVQIVQATTGGGFGGKEDFPSILACQAATAAIRLGKPVKVFFERREDVSVTPKRHPGLLKYKSAIKGDKVIGMEIEVILDGGAYTSLSAVVLQRSLICASGVYDIPNLKISGKVAKTNSVPNGAFRGFGAPQSFFAVEAHMAHISRELNIQVLEFKKRHLVKQGSKTSTGGEFRDPIILEEMIKKAEKLSGYPEKIREYAKQSGRFKKGVGMSLFLHGCGFTGGGERDHIKAKVKLKKNKDNTVEILVSNTDMGQGLKTTFSKIVSEVLKLPLDKIFIHNPDTDKVPDSGPTVASRSLMVVGYLISKAAKRLKNQWVDCEPLVIEENYVHPELIPWDLGSFSGDAYPAYSWGVNVLEVEVDTLTAQTNIIGVWGIFDVGRAIDENVMKGQIEGGMLQGIGYGSMENMELHDGLVRQNSFTDYIIPTAKDIVNIHSLTMDNPYQYGPFGAKGAGELTLIGGAPAYAAAVENAIGANVYQIPVTPEVILEKINTQVDTFVMDKLILGG